MHALKVLAAAAALLFAAPAFAQEMGGATGPGGPGGLEPTYNSGYDQGGFGRLGGDTLDGNNSYAMSPRDGFCAERYRSDRPASGTYTSYDGRRRSCR
jgi:hypothetical protein